MRETSIMDNLNCKTQAHVMKRCAKKLNKKKKDNRPLKILLKDGLYDTTLETVRKWIVAWLPVMILQSMKILIFYYIYTIMHAIGKHWS